MRGQRERPQSMFVAFNIEERVPDAEAMQHAGSGPHPSGDPVA